MTDPDWRSPTEPSRRIPGAVGGAVPPESRPEPTELATEARRSASWASCSDETAAANTPERRADSWRFSSDTGLATTAAACAAACQRSRELAPCASRSDGGAAPAEGSGPTVLVSARPAASDDACGTRLGGGRGGPEADPEDRLDDSWTSTDARRRDQVTSSVSTFQK